MRTDLFDYELPPGLIAQRPAERREDSRLLVVDCVSGDIAHRSFPDLVDYLEAGDCLVLNASRVRHARLRGRKLEGGGEVELLLLSPDPDGTWAALARPARRLRPGTEVSFGGGELVAEVVEKSDRGELRVRMRPGELAAVEAAVERLGEIPLPPYIREMPPDPGRYQTVYARDVGSAAAPTAGLHFEAATLHRLEEKGVRTAFLYLDVGLDTFRPISEEEIEGHRIHSENMRLDAEACETINAARGDGRMVVAVGTTVVRALESAAGEGGVQPRQGATDLFIYPGYRFRAVDCLLTNFHMPRSSLLVLVCAFAGRETVMEAYRQAAEEGYRFLSFGDACFFRYPGARGEG
ncbi:MAG: tRNA preQ1(34) S-adenosylmethionine ribosyltransferase-isomerase QueA [Actinomycetota bacterium]